MLVRLSLMNKKSTAFLFFLASSISLFLYACSPQTAAVLPTDTADAAIVDSPATATPFIPPPSPVSTETVDLNTVSLPAGIQLEFWHPWSGELAELMTELVETIQSGQSMGH